MATVVQIPDFDFSGFYYPQILEALTEYKRRNVPELTEESEFEPFTQFTRMQALVGHLNNVLLDLVANEATLPTAKLAETVRNMLRLIDYELATASPSQADVIYELAKVLTTSTEVVRERAQAATKRQPTGPQIFFEALEALTVSQTDRFSRVYAEEDGSFTDFTTEANSPTTPADDWTPWSTPALKDAVYFGHTEAMWAVLSIFVSTAAVGITGVWEYYDGNYSKVAPTSVTDNGSYLTFDLTSYLGTSNRAGTQIRVRFNETGAYEDMESTWTGTENVASTVGLLGQTAPSTTATDYTVGSQWEALTDVEDGSLGLTQDGQLKYTTPQTGTENWKLGEVDGYKAYWLRFRIVAVSTPSSPVLKYARMDEGKQYVKRQGTQGRTYSEDPLGSSTGLANQAFEAGQDFFIWGSEKLWVEGEQWVRVDNFLGQSSSAKVYVVELGANDRPTFKFGNGAAGKIPPLGVNNISVEYRYGANNDGNVGADTIVVDKSSLSFVNRLWNPRPAAGWGVAEGATEESREQAKIAGPASLRAKDVAIGPDDLVTLTKNFTDETGAKPYSRARAFEEGFGPKTVELVVVIKGGGQASPEQLAALEEYFNGDQTVYPPKEKHFVANQEVVAVNFSSKPIDITATVYGDVELEVIETRLQQTLQPEALRADGVTWEWNFGEEVPDSRINHLIFGASADITKVDLTEPAAPVGLLPRELPTFGTLNITIVP